MQLVDVRKRMPLSLVSASALGFADEVAVSLPFEGSGDFVN